MATVGRSRTPRPAWMERPSAGMQALKVLILAGITVVMLYPFIYVLAVSISNSNIVRRGGVVLWPREVTMEAYRVIFGTGIVSRSLFVSIGITLVGTALSVLMTVTLAYGLTRTREVPGTRFVLYLALFTMLFGAGIIPNYLLIKALGMLNTYASLIIPPAISAFNLVVIRNFFMNIPRELLDSARVDGANEWRVLWSIVMPLSKAVTAVIALFYGVGYWNNFFNALLYIRDAQKWPIQLVLNQYVVQGTPLAQVANPDAVQLAPEVIKMAVLVVATVPILMAYPFLQKYFTKGVLTGAIKQ